MKAKNVSGYIVVNYGVNRGKGRKIEHKNGKLRIRGDFDTDETHDRIKNLIAIKNPGWSITGYCPAKPLAAKPRPSVDHVASGKSLADATEVKLFYAVMKAQSWSALSALGLPLEPEDRENGPCRFIPVFDSREAAIAWDGSEEHVREMRTAQ